MKTLNTTLNATRKNNEMIVKNDLLTVKTNAVIDSMQYAKFWENGFRMKRIPSQKYLFLTEFEGRTVTYRARFPHFNLWLEWSHSDHALKWKKTRGRNLQYGPRKRGL